MRRQMVAAAVKPFPHLSFLHTLENVAFMNQSVQDPLSKWNVLVSPKR